MLALEKGSELGNQLLGIGSAGERLDVTGQRAGCVIKQANGTVASGCVDGEDQHVHSPEDTKVHEGKAGNPTLAHPARVGPQLHTLRLLLAEFQQDAAGAGRMNEDIQVSSGADLDVFIDQAHARVLEVQVGAGGHLYVFVHPSSA